MSAPSRDGTYEWQKRADADGNVYIWMNGSWVHTSANGALLIANKLGYVAITLNAGADVDIENTAAAAGDLLTGIQFNTAPGEDVIVRDGTVDVFTIPSPSAGAVWNAPGGGVVAKTKWALKDTTTATDTVICVGSFS